MLANREMLDGIEVIVQPPDMSEEEVASLRETVQARYEQMDAARRRWLEVLHHQLHQRTYRKRTEIALEIVTQLEQEGHFPAAHDAFDHGLLPLELTRYMEGVGKHWVSERESSRHSQWQGQWRRVEAVATTLRHGHPESFRPVRVRGRNGDTKHYWALTKVGWLTRYGRKRLVMVHEHAEFTDTPRFVLTDAQHWESGRVMETWSYRWASDIFHEFGKQGTGMEAAQGRQEEAVTRPFRLSGVAQSLLQRAPTAPSASERCAGAQGAITVGQKARAIVREALEGLLRLAASLLARGRKGEQILELRMPV